MSKSKKGTERKRTRKIYIGPDDRPDALYWRVEIDDATKPVTINGSAMHALKAHAGVTIGCAISNVATDKRNMGAFPHAVFFAEVTKTRLFIVDQVHKDGTPKHAVAYEHRYGHITDANDTGTLKKMVEENPDVMEKSFTFRPPRPQPPSGATAGQTAPEDRNTRGRGKVYANRGALARAVKAGRIGKHVAQQITNVLGK